MHSNLCDPSLGGRAVLITGFGGSGTHSLSAMFRMNGLDLPHEEVGEGGSVSWAYAVDVRHTAFAGAECVAAGKKPRTWLTPPHPVWTRFRNVYHVVRCPVDVIPSTMAWEDEHCSMRYMNATLELGWPYAMDYGDLRFWAKAWLAQNEFIESYAQMTFRLDSFKDVYEQVCKDSGVNKSMCLNATLPRAGRRSESTLTWANLTASVGAELAGAVRRAAVRYGFGEDCLDDAARAREGKAAMHGSRQVVTHGIPGAECSGERGRDCTDGLDWVWEAPVVDMIKRSTEAPFRKAWEEIQVHAHAPGP